MTDAGRIGPRPVMIDNSVARVMGSGAMVKISSSDTGEQLFAMEYDMQPHTLGTPHTHTYEDQVAYVLTGELGYRIGDEEFRAPSGASVFMPRGLPHTVFNPTDAPARMLELTTPGRLFRMFEELSGLRTSGDTDEETLRHTRESFGFLLNPEWIAEMEQRHGVTWKR